MTIHRLKTTLFAALVAVGAFAGGAVSAQADTLEDILEVGESRNAAGKKSQVKIDRLTVENTGLLAGL